MISLRCAKFQPLRSVVFKCRLRLGKRSFSMAEDSSQYNFLREGYQQAEPSADDQIIVAMSSGVDSSVCAALFAEKYSNVKGIYMANWSQTAKCTEADWNDVQKVCRQLNIPCERVNFEKEYWNDVFQPMVQMYEQGLTPNPDLGCNRHVKFGRLAEYLEKKYSGKRKWWLVTGHYARVMNFTEKEEFHLLRAFYKPKDQSYYLSNISRAILPRVLMPIGHLTKPKVRELAHKFGLHTASKPDSQGLCFVSQDENKFKTFLDEYIQPKPGNIVTEDGKIWGQHQGLWHGTIGQKLGISMPQGDPIYKGIWFISEKRLDTNELVIVKGTKNEKLFKSNIRVENWEWMTDDIKSIIQRAPSGQLDVQYRSLQLPFRINSLAEHDNIVEINLTKPARAMAPGQAVVLYDGNQVLGSGILTQTW